MKIVLWRRQAFNTSDDQKINTRPIGSDNVRASIVDPLDMDAFLPISCDEMTTVRDAIGSSVSWPKKLITLDT